MNNMYWADKIADEIIKSNNYKPYWVDDMKTPSGRIHVGALRGVAVHGLVYQALLDRKVDAEFTWVFENHDPMDEVSSDLNKEEWGKYLGQPLYKVPSPGPGAENYADYFANEFMEVFNKIGFTPKILYTSDLYESGRMNEGIKLCLDNVQVIRDIFANLYKKEIASNWYPFQIVCPECGKIATSKVTDWDGKEVTFTCEVDAVKYTKGCGYSGKTSPFSGEGKYVGKLSWKIEWAVKWMVIGVTVEGAGKDHMVAGGSHDVASLVCEKVLNYPVPYPIPYEFFLIGGKKMSSSKGLGSSAKQVSEMLPPHLLRFLFVRTDYHKTIEFNPTGTMLIPDLFDEYDRCWQAYISGSDEYLSKMFVVSQIHEVPEKTSIFLPRFVDIANYIQQSSVKNIEERFAEIKGSPLTELEKSILAERQSYAKVWIDNYAPDEYRLMMVSLLPEQVKTLTQDQKTFLSEVAKLIKVESTPEELQEELYQLSKRLKIDSKTAFAAIYLSFIGKEHGPKAAWFLQSYPKGEVVSRLEEVSNLS